MNDNEQSKKFPDKNTLVLAAALLLIVLLVQSFFPLTRFYYHMKNGKHFETTHYSFDLPPEWFSVGKSEVAYVLSAGSEDHKSIFAEIAIDPLSVELNYLLKQCDSFFSKQKSYKYISGDEYLCQFNDHEELYFYSDTKNIFVRIDPYFHEDSFGQYYAMLFNSIKSK